MGVASQITDNAFGVIQTMPALQHPVLLHELFEDVVNFFGLFTLNFFS